MDTPTSSNAASGLPAHQTYPGRIVDSTLGQELLRSEVKRVTLLVALLAFVLLCTVAMRLAPQALAPELRDRLFSGLGPLSLVIGGYLLYELSVLIWLTRLARAGRALPKSFQYINVFIEISLPTVALLIGASIIDPLSILAGAIPSLYFLFILIAALNLDFRLCAFAGSAACVQFLAASLYLVGRSTAPLGAGIPVIAMMLSPHQYILKGALLLAAGLIAGFVASQIRRQIARVFQTLGERDRAVSIFGQHVSPEVAELLLTQPLNSAGQEQLVCVMFLDIRDFSKFSSEHSATEVVEYLNILFAPMIPVINNHSGIVNKFLGDGFMAVFGAPLVDGQQATHALHASLKILRQVEFLNQQGMMHPTRIGIGLHIGQAVTGNVGSSQRKEYTIIGDVVNLASRIEQANKALATQILVSEATVQAAARDGEFAFEDMGLIELKGQPHPVRLYKLA
jgi:adenylate cyclase